MGGAYIFNDGQKALTVIGSTKTGSMLDFRYFYDSLGDNNSIGAAFKDWFEDIAPYDEWDLFWHYGMTISGDPMIVFLGVIYPPLDFSGYRAENRSLSQAEYINVLSWTSNPKNSNKDIVGYRIYRVEQNDLSLLVDLSAETFEYLHRYLERDTVYTYAIVAVDDYGSESPPNFTEVR